MKSNLRDDVCYAQPKTLQQRVAIANDFMQRFHYPLPFGIDDMNDAANSAYAAWPERIYIVGEDGRIAYAGGIGPFKYRPEEARDWLIKKFGPAQTTPQAAATR
jgi:type I thyroxine 5'-deiodinase